jgi:TRAP-type mannitol/chloroaromatic compound transport system permease small subunit
MHSTIRLIESLTTRTGFLISLTVIPLVLTATYEVFARYVFGAPTIWAYELGCMITGTHFLIGAAMTLARDGHVRIDILYDRLSLKSRAFVNLAFYVVLFLPFLALLNDALWHYAITAFHSGERSGNSAWNPPIWPFRMLLAFGFILLALQVIAECLKSLLTLLNRPYSDVER